MANGYNMDAAQIIKAAFDPDNQALRINVVDEDALAMIGGYNMDAAQVIKQVFDSDNQALRVNIVEGGGGGGGANTALSNLVAPTAINADLLPDANGTRSIGDGSLGWLSIYTNNLTTVSDNSLIVATSTNTGTGNSGSLELRTTDATLSGVSGDVFIGTGASTVGNSGNLALRTGSSAGSNSGNISLETGSSGTQGSISLAASSVDLYASTITLVNGSEGTVGHVWTSTGSGGEGAWAAAGGGGANTTLSNLGTTAINAALIPSGSINLGTPTNLWNRLYISELRNSTNQTTVSIPSRLLLGASGTTLDWGIRALYENTGTSTIEWGNKRLTHNNNTVLSWSTSAVTVSANTTINASLTTAASHKNTAIVLITEGDSPYTVSETADRTILCEPAAPLSVNLPEGTNGMEFIFKGTFNATGTTTINTSGADTLDTGATSFSITDDGRHIIFFNGLWHSIGQSGGF